MNPRAVAVLIAIAIVAVILAVLGLPGTSPPAEAPAGNAPSPELTAELEQTRAENERMRQELTQAQDRLRLLEQPDSPGPEPEPLPEPAVEETPAEPPQSPDEPSLDEVREFINGNAAATAQIQALTELLFADLFASLDLDPQAKAALRQLLLDSQMEEVALSRYAMQRGDIPWNETTQWRDAERARLSQQVQALLTDAEYEQWAHYAATIDEGLLEVSLENQIRAFASGLSPENHEIVMQVAIEEFRAEQLILEQSDTPYTLSENIHYQIRAMDHMRERLQPHLPGDQFAEIENWLVMGENVLRGSLPNDTATTP